MLPLNVLGPVWLTISLPPPRLSCPLPLKEEMVWLLASSWKMPALGTASAVVVGIRSGAAPTERVPLLKPSVPSHVLEPRKAMAWVPSLIRLPLIIVPEKQEY